MSARILVENLIIVPEFSPIFSNCKIVYTFFPFKNSSLTGYYIQIGRRDGSIFSFNDCFEKLVLNELNLIKLF